MGAESATKQHVLLAGGILLSGATQFRFVGPVGPGECLLVLWAATALWSVRHRLRLAPAQRPILLFLMTSGVLLLLGSVVSGLSGIHVRNAARDACALLLSAGLVAAVILTPDRTRLETVARVLVLSTAALLSIVYVAACFGLGGAVLDPWWPALGRFQGWAINPNQLAFQLVLVPFLALAVLRPGPGVWMPLAGIVAAFIGLTTGSKAVAIAWMTGVLSVLVVTRLGSRSTIRQCYGAPGQGLLVAVCLLTILFATVIWPQQLMLRTYFGPSTVQTLPFKVRQSRQLRNRRLLATNGLIAAIESPLVGWGPGAHSGLSGPHRRRSAHVTFIDWACSTGLTGLTGLCLLFGYVGRLLWVRNPRLVPLLIVLFAFALFHSVLRQPLWWLLPVLLLETVAGSPAEAD